MELKWNLTNGTIVIHRLFGLPYVMHLTLRWANIKEGVPVKAKRIVYKIQIKRIQRVADIPPSSFVRYLELLCLYNIGKKHTPYRYSDLRPPASWQEYSWVFSCCLKACMDRHYRQAWPAAEKSFPNCRNMAQNLRKSFLRSSSACCLVMVWAEYLSPGCKQWPQPT